MQRVQKEEERKFKVQNLENEGALVSDKVTLEIWARIEQGTK